MSRKQGGAGTPAIAALARAGVEFTAHSYEHDPATASFGLEAAEKLGLPDERVLKTLMVEADSRLVVAIVPVDRRVDLKAVAAVLGVKRATMADPEQAQRATGYVVGGISPLGQRRRHATVLDAAAARHDRVLVSGGRRGLDVELRTADLVTLTEAITADIAR